ncbi:hypothetical protein D3C72_2448550 [compost metagenome]
MGLGLRDMACSSAAIASANAPVRVLLRPSRTSAWAWIPLSSAVILPSAAMASG